MADPEAKNSVGLYEESSVTERTESFRYAWEAGLAGGIIGGVCMGIILHAGANVMPFIGALYGWPTVIGGWVAHLVNSILIGLLFALILSHPLIRKEITSLTECTVAGIVYAAAVGLVTGGLMLPVSMTLIGVSSFPQPLLFFPEVLGGVFVAFSIGVAHAVYGLVLGATYGVVTNSTKNNT